ncbi:MAG: D-methionine transport system substrate-binding protein [Kosmotogales bacterium]|nr:D-methionine transport system substrate-binding protein [Kosmotogales bacterium]
MKKVVFVLFLVCLVSLSFAATKIRIGATPVPHAEILDFIKDDFEELGYDLEIVVFNDYVLPNLSLSNGEIDANYFQHVPYLKDFTAKRGITNLVSAALIHVEPMGFYLKKDLNELKKGDKIVVPNDPTNEGRGLLLLHNNGIITLKEPDNLSATVADIVENPYGLNFVEVEAGFIPRAYVDDKNIVGAIINTNYAIPIGLNPLVDALFSEGGESPYANIITVREEDLNEKWLEDLLSVLTSDKVKNFILEKYEGAVVPVF